jgi:hypothetical protein
MQDTPDSNRQLAQRLDAVFYQYFNYHEYVTTTMMVLREGIRRSRLRGKWMSNASLLLGAPFTISLARLFEQPDIAAIVGLSMFVLGVAVRKTGMSIHKAFMSVGDLVAWDAHTGEIDSFGEKLHRLHAANTLTLADVEALEGELARLRNFKPVNPIKKLLPVLCTIERLNLQNDDDARQKALTAGVGATVLFWSKHIPTVKI